MKKVTSSVSFWTGIAFSVILFLVINVIDVINQSSKICFDCDKGYGKPFRIYESGSMIHNREVLWGGLVADVIVVTLIGVAIGLIFYFTMAKLFNRPPLK